MHAVRFQLGGIRRLEEGNLMATTVEGHPVRDERTAEIVGAGSIAEAVGAAAAIVLAILGLAGTLPLTMASVATIALGAALLFEGGAIAARYKRLLAETIAPGERRRGRFELGGGVTAETVAGIAGIVLGILALLDVMPLLLTAVAVIVFGAALLFGSAATARLNAIAGEEAYARDKRRVVHEAVAVAAGGELIIGVGALVLGILALLAFEPLTLILVGLLGLGFAALAGGTALGARMLGIARHA
jgi:hypothetical protein